MVQKTEAGQQAWNNHEQAFADRVDSLRTGVQVETTTPDSQSATETIAFNAATVIDDAQSDQITNAAVRDWIFGQLSELSLFDELLDVLN